MPFQKGNKLSPRVRPDMTGSKNNKWKGDNAGYFSVHSWINRWYGKANHCEHCGTKAVKMFHWANISGKSKRDINDYKQLCVSCHRKFDKGNFCKHGHEFTKENTWIRKNGWRVCRICSYERLIKAKTKQEEQKKGVEIFVVL